LKDALKDDDCKILHHDWRELDSKLNSSLKAAKREGPIEERDFVLV
jgi:hypothetical protein